MSPEHSFRGEIENLDERLGNLLDNACKWAKATVAVESAAEDGSVLITVDDDGPGLDPSTWEKALHSRRARRRGGAGLGVWSRDRARSGGALWRLDRTRPLSGGNL
ncbi:MAG: ATP-binding protein, partial [Thermoanaerobaculia bacterium]